MTGLLCFLLLASPLTAQKQGGLPPMLLDPDAFTGSQQGGLPSGLGSVLDDVTALPGARFGLGVIDLKTGERITRNGSGRFYMDRPDIVNAVVCIDRHNSGILRLDSMLARNEDLWQIVRRGQQGARESTQAARYYMGGHEIVDQWLVSSGFSSTYFPGVQLDWEGAPEYDPSYTTVSDCLDFMEIVYEFLDIRDVRRMTTNPPLSDDLENSIASDEIVYGWTSGRGDTRCINLIIFKPDGSKYGVCVLANDLCCQAKADLAFTMIWSSL